MIEASRCPACDRVAVPPETRCLACREETEPTNLAPEGTVLARTQPASEEGAWVALVELAGGARVLARVPPRTPVGTPVELRRGADLLEGRPPA